MTQQFHSYVEYKKNEKKNTYMQMFIEALCRI